MDELNKDQEPSYKDGQESISNFLSTFYIEDNNGKEFTYLDQIHELAMREQVALHIDLDQMQRTHPEMVRWIQNNARRYAVVAADAVHQQIHEHLRDIQTEMPVKDTLDAFIYQRLEMAKQLVEKEGVDLQTSQSSYPPQLLRRFEVYFKAPSDQKPLSIRDIKAAHIGKLVSVRGIVIRSTEVKPQADVITYTCDTCANETYQPIGGPTFMPALDCPSADCRESKANGRLIMQGRGSKFVKFQELRIQEHSDQVPVGSIPRMITIYARGENTRLAAPGDHIVLTGVFLPQMKAPGFKQQFAGLLNDVFIDAHHIENVNRAHEGDETNENDELTDAEIDIVAQPNFYDHLSYSIAPEIFGHDDIKKSLLLQLVGGVDKNAVGMKIRGAINVCLMGDPGVAKSQLLSYVDRLAPRSQYTTGRGSSGVGLTAAVMRDPVTGEMTLEGGALVIADRGICCIDEFDKMQESDRTAIHEVMEQQTISIAKAGIMTTLNARVSILAAANPAYGRYNPKKSIEHNIQLPAALLSRFDLLWLIQTVEAKLEWLMRGTNERMLLQQQQEALRLLQDKPDRDNDLRIAQHITFVHRNNCEPQKAGMDPLDMKLVRKYIGLCKRKQPVVSEQLTESIVAMYVQMRREARNNTDTTFTSPRVLLATLRLATALARLRLSNNVIEGDVQEAFRLMEKSKDSLRPGQNEKQRQQQPVDQLYAVLRELYQQDMGDADDHMISVEDAKRKANTKGFDDNVFEECLQQYEEAGVWMFDEQRNNIIFCQ